MRLRLAPAFASHCSTLEPIETAPGQGEPDGHWATLASRRVSWGQCRGGGKFPGSPARVAAAAGSPRGPGAGGSGSTHKGKQGTVGKLRTERALPSGVGEGPRRRERPFRAPEAPRAEPRASRTGGASARFSAKKNFFFSIKKIF